MAAMDLLARAQAGDGEAFGQLVDPYRRELQVHCYRILGSVQDAEDALQDTLLSAWQGLAGFEGRASVRTWLYHVATSRCLDALRSASRRPLMSAPPPVSAFESIHGLPRSRYRCTPGWLNRMRPCDNVPSSPRSRMATAVSANQL